MRWTSPRWWRRTSTGSCGWPHRTRSRIQNGLYAAAAGAILYAVFGTSRQISTGPSAVVTGSTSWPGETPPLDRPEV
jgi:hypothetical protein